MNRFFSFDPFGSPMSLRSFNTTSSRYGFNGKEKDDEINVNGGSYDFGDRIYDPRIGRWLSLDPLMRKYAGLSPYNFTFNNPIIFNDPDGRDGRLTVVDGKDGSVNITLETNIHIYGADASTASAAALTKAYKDAGFDKTRTFKGADGKTYNVAIKITYSAENSQAIKEQQSAAEGNTSARDIYEASSLDKTKLKDFVAGDNIMEIDSKKELGKPTGASAFSGAVSGEGATDKTNVHEPFHLFGFDEAYDITKMGSDMPGMEGDVMTAGEGYIYTMKNGKPTANPDFKISAIHYQNIINYVIDNSIKGTKILDPSKDKIESTGAGTKPPSPDKIKSANNSEVK